MLIFLGLMYLKLKALKENTLKYGVIIWAKDGLLELEVGRTKSKSLMVRKEEKEKI